MKQEAEQVQEEQLDRERQMRAADAGAGKHRWRQPNPLAKMEADRQRNRKTDQREKCIWSSATSKCLQQNPEHDPAAMEEDLAGELEENDDRER
jgi:hypothetical protein